MIMQSAMKGYFKMCKLGCYVHHLRNIYF